MTVIYTNIKNTHRETHKYTQTYNFSIKQIFSKKYIETQIIKPVYVHTKNTQKNDIYTIKSSHQYFHKKDIKLRTQIQKP